MLWEALGEVLAWAEKVDNCWVRCWPAHFGHSTSSVPRRTSFSNFVPQESQAYSKIGMFLVYQRRLILHQCQSNPVHHLPDFGGRQGVVIGDDRKRQPGSALRCHVAGKSTRRGQCSCFRVYC